MLNQLQKESRAQGTNSKQARENQPCRAGGGNTDAEQYEQHGSARGVQIAIGGSAGSGATDTGAKVGGRREFRGHGNSAGLRFHGNASPTLNPGDVSIERHAQSKDLGQGKRFKAGKTVGMAENVDANIQVSTRRHGAGNNADGGHEKDGSKKATRLDMSTKRFQR